MSNLSGRTLELIRENALFHLAALKCEHQSEEVLKKIDEINALLEGVNYQLELIEEYHA